MLCYRTDILGHPRPKALNDASLRKPASDNSVNVTCLAINSLMPVSPKKNTTLLIYLLPQSKLVGSCRRIVNLKPNDNSPSNILKYHSLTLCYFQRFH